MKVKLLAHTPEPEKVVAAAARLCYSPVGAEELLDQLTPAKVEELVNRLLQLGHLSPFEHVSFTFAVEGVSRVLSHQLVRHRIASYSQQSQRYVKESQFDYITPPQIQANAAAATVFQEAMHVAQAAYNALTAAGVHPEDARYILPNACETKLVFTFNCRSLYNFFELRCCQRAQWEIRGLAEEMLRLVREVAPRLFTHAGPTCETRGYCREGEFTCGRLAARQGGGGNNAFSD